MGVATKSPWLAAWAGAVGAIDVITGDRAPDTRTPHQQDLPEAFIDQPYNGWAHKQVGRKASAYYLPSLVESAMTYVEFVGSLLAHAPGYLTDNRDVEDMKRALPPEWAAQAAALLTRRL